MEWKNWWQHKYKYCGRPGKGYFDAYKTRLANYDLKRIRVQDFVREMDLAYAVADVVISRAGALSVSDIGGRKNGDIGAIS